MRSAGSNDHTGPSLVLRQSDESEGYPRPLIPRLMDGNSESNQRLPQVVAEFVMGGLGHRGWLFRLNVISQTDHT